LVRRPNVKKDVPTIAIEFVSAGKRNAFRDYETKRLEYLSVGVVGFWIIDRFCRTLTVHRKTAKSLSSWKSSKLTKSNYCPNSSAPG
jgi:Uma2 family endonuclease